MYSKLRKYYKSDEPDSSGLDLEEMEDVAEEIRMILVGPKGLPLLEYVKVASEIPLTKLGHRRIYSIKNEPKIEVYFPLDVWEVLKTRCDAIKCCRLTSDDDNFIKKNSGRGFNWLSQKMYISKDSLYLKAKKLGVDVVRKDISYKPCMVDFIKKHANKGYKWISERLGVSYYSVRNKCIREKIFVVKKESPHSYTPKEDVFIKRNAYRGTQWIADKLKMNNKSIRRRARRLGIKLAKFQKNGIKYFIPREDNFIKENLTKGVLWVAHRLKRTVKSVARRAQIKGWRFPNSNRHYYSEQDNSFIKQNQNKGLEYLAAKFYVTPDSLYGHAKKIGVWLHYAKAKK